MHAARHAPVLGGCFARAIALLRPFAPTGMEFRGLATAWNTFPRSHTVLEAPWCVPQENSGPRL
eukprot:11193970-Lingulodinium_polyedra.AAC.1